MFKPVPATGPAEAEYRAATDFTVRQLMATIAVALSDRQPGPDRVRSALNALAVVSAGLAASDGPKAEMFFQACFDSQLAAIRRDGAADLHIASSSSPAATVFGGARD